MRFRCNDAEKDDLPLGLVAPEPYSAETVRAWCEAGWDLHSAFWSPKTTAYRRVWKSLHQIHPFRRTKWPRDIHEVIANIKSPSKRNRSPPFQRHPLP